MAKSLLTLLVCLFTISLVSAQDVASLSNSDIVTMVRAKLPAALIVEKINTSSCTFDTFPSVLAELKYKGVPDEVLMAMVKAPHGARPKALPNDDAVSERAQDQPSSSERGGSPTVREGSTSSAARQSSSSRNTGGLIFSDHPGSPYNARFYVAPMEEGFDGLISALMLEKKLPLTITADENLADFIVVGATNKGTQKWYDTVFGSGYERDRNQGSIRVIRVRDKTVIWAAQKGDRSLWWGALKKGGKRKVAERLVNDMKGDLFKGGF